MRHAMVTAAARTADSASLEIDEAMARNEFRSLDENVQDAEERSPGSQPRPVPAGGKSFFSRPTHRFAFFISMDVGEYFELDSVQHQDRRQGSGQLPVHRIAK